MQLIWTTRSRQIARCGGFCLDLAIQTERGGGNGGSGPDLAIGTERGANGGAGPDLATQRPRMCSRRIIASLENSTGMAVTCSARTTVRALVQRCLDKPTVLLYTRALPKGLRWVEGEP